MYIRSHHGVTMYQLRQFLCKSWNTQIKVVWITEVFISHLTSPGLADHLAISRFWVNMSLVLTASLISHFHTKMTAKAPSVISSSHNHVQTQKEGSFLFLGPSVKAKKIPPYISRLDLDRVTGPQLDRAPRWRRLHSRRQAEPSRNNQQNPPWHLSLLTSRSVPICWKRPQTAQVDSSWNFSLQQFFLPDIHLYRDASTTKKHPGWKYTTATLLWSHSGTAPAGQRR